MDLKKHHMQSNWNEQKKSQDPEHVLFDLTVSEFQILDEFEDEDYYRDVVDVTLKDETNVQAAIYVWQDSLRSLLYGAWDYEEFREKDLAAFLQMMDDWENSGEFPEDPPEEIG